MELDDKTKEEGLKTFENNHPNEEEIYELEPEEIEQELIGIYIKLLEKKYKGLPKKKKGILIDLQEGTNMTPEFDYISKIMERNPEFRRLLKRMQRKEDEDEEDDDKSNLYI